MTDKERVARFLLGGEVVEVADVSPAKSVLNFLREDLRRKGTKEGCAEGDCGACTVVLGELAGDEVRLRAVNACIQFVPSLDGKALYTVEDLRQDGALHPVQQAMVDCHGSQCGFCTPGFVMSLWNVYADCVTASGCGKRPSETELRTALTGNLCRCTGYRPILEAGQRMFDHPPVHLDRAALAQKLKGLQRSEALAYKHGNRRFLAPRSLAQLVAGMNQYACSNSQNGLRFTTAFLGEYDAGDRSFSYINAGHNAPVVRRSSGSIERLTLGGLPLGIQQDSLYESGSIALQSGDWLVIFTDGLVEAVNQADEEFGEQRLLDVLNMGAAVNRQRCWIG